MMMIGIGDVVGLRRGPAQGSFGLFWDEDPRVRGGSEVVLRVGAGLELGNIL